MSNFKDYTMPLSGGLSARITVWTERLLFAAILLLPFNDFPYFRGVLREIGAEAAFFPLALGVFAVFAVWMTGKGGDVMPGSRPFSWIKVFLAWILITTLTNAVGISGAVFKGRTGWERNLLQTVLIGFCAVTVVFVSWVSQRKDVRQAIPKWAILSLLVPGIYSAIEIFYMYGFGGGDLLRFLSKFVSYNAGVYFRLHSVSGEPSWFAIYCAFVFPWILFALITSGKRNLLWLMPLSAYLIFMVVLTFSRAAYTIVLLELFVFMGFAAVIKSTRVRALSLSGFLICVGILANFLSPKVSINDGYLMESPIGKVFGSVFSKESPAYAQSNSARYGGQLSMLRMGSENPFFGVGLGQAGFHIANFMPEWLKTNPEAVLWADPSPDTPWPPSHGLHARVFAEMGAVGAAVWILTWLLLVIGLLRALTHSLRDGVFDFYGLALISGVFGLLLVGFVADSFRFMEYWVLLGFCFAYLEEKQHLPSSRFGQF